MTPFVRFILTLLLVGIVLNLVIALLAGAASDRRRQSDMAAQQQLFSKVLQAYNNAQRRAEIAVDWQRIGKNDEVLESALIIRRDLSLADAASRPPRIDRVTIPGGRVYVDGLMLEFNAWFPEQFRSLRNCKLGYFDRVYGETASGQPQPPVDQFALLLRDQVPEATRIYPAQQDPTFFEIHLWQTLWNLIPDPAQPAAVTATLARAAKTGVSVKRFPAAARTVRNGKAYVAFLGAEGLTLDEAPPGLYETIISDAQRYQKPDTNNQ